jgi:transposase-like protein
MSKASEEGRSGSGPREKRVRRRHSIAQKVAIVRQCLEPGTSLAGVALVHRINANMVRKWVVTFQKGGYGQPPEAGTSMLPVVVKAPAASCSPSKVTTAKPTIEIEMTRGVVRFSGTIDPAVLRLLVEAMSA